MIQWNSFSYSMSESENDFNNLELKVKSVEPIDPREDFLELRKLLIDARDKVFEKNGFDFSNNLTYDFDLLYGLELYQVLNKDIGFNQRVASNDDIWRYLSIRVIPDVVHSRWGFN